MKILHYINDLGSGGAEKLLSDILPYMEKKNHEIHVAVSNHNSSFSRNVNKLQYGNVKVINLNFHFYNPRQVIKLVRLIRRERYDIVHAHLFPSKYWLAIASLFVQDKIQFIKTEHSVHNERKDYKVLQPLEKFIYGRYKYIIGITDEVTSNLQNWLERTNGFVTINNGVNLQEIKESQSNINLSEYSFLDPSCYNILMVSRFDGVHKDQLSLINAFSGLPLRFQLYFAGQGPDEKNINELVKKRGLENRIHFLGVRKDVYKLMHLVDLNVLSTKQEGLSGVALESLASGRPFIGSDVSGVREIVPSQLFLFPPNNPEALKIKILELSKNKDLTNRLITMAKEYITKFDISKMADSYLELYNSITHQ